MLATMLMMAIYPKLPIFEEIQEVRIDLGIDCQKERVIIAFETGCNEIREALLF